MSFRVSTFLQSVASGDQNAVSAILAAGADVNAKNDGGQTPLIVAIVSAQHHLLLPLLQAGADPLLEDNTGLNAIKWAERKGRPDLAQLLASDPNKNLAPKNGQQHLDAEAKRAMLTAEDLPRSKGLTDDEKSRMFLAGLKQRLDEKARRKQASGEHPQTEKEAHRQTAQPDNWTTSSIAVEQTHSSSLSRESVPLAPRQTAQPDNWTTPSIAVEQTHSSSLSHEPVPLAEHSEKVIRKRCPECNRTYTGELIAYCAYHIVPLVDANEPVVVPKTNNPSTFFWLLVIVTAVAAALAGLFLTNLLLSNNNAPASKAVAAPVPTTRRGIPVLGRELLGKAVMLPEAEQPAVAVTQLTSITVQVKIDKTGRVYSAFSSSGDRALREVAIGAAKKATFSVEKLRARGTEGTITYTFNP